MDISQQHYDIKSLSFIFDSREDIDRIYVYHKDSEIPLQKIYFCLDNVKILTLFKKTPENKTVEGVKIAINNSENTLKFIKNLNIIEDYIKSLIVEREKKVKRCLNKDSYPLTLNTVLFNDSIFLDNQKITKNDVQVNMIGRIYIELNYFWSLDTTRYYKIRWSCLHLELKNFKYAFQKMIGNNYIHNNDNLPLTIEKIYSEIEELSSKLDKLKKHIDDIHKKELRSTNTHNIPQPTLPPPPSTQRFIPGVVELQNARKNLNKHKQTNK